MPSTVISYFNYDASRRVLTITFITGNVYQYLRVPQRVYEMLKASGSKGRYFNHFIKNKYGYRKLAPENS
jgi:hypothetical protein